MLNLRFCLILTTVMLATTPAWADLKAIQKDKLPQDESVLNALAEVSSIEQMVDHWSGKWPYQQPRKQVAAELKSSMAAIEEEAKLSPENEELLLLLGLVAHYSSNLDAKGSYEIAVDSLTKAQKLAPQDLRAAWFLGLHQCQSGTQNQQGMQEFLEVESSPGSQQLPAAFWDDYLQCSMVNNMPAHGLRAGERANKLDPQPSQVRSVLLEAIGERFQRPDPAATYPAKEVWFAQNARRETVFTSFLFGLRFSSPAEWRLNLPDVKEGFGMAQFEAGPYPGKGDEVTPNILVIARPPKPGETLQDLLTAVTKKYGGSAIPARVCPAHECLAWEATTPGMYKQDGDGHMIVTVFQRDAPEYPDLLFEEPAYPFEHSNDGKVHFFRPGDHLTRFAGTLYYLVMVDTADSVLQNARQDYDTFLKNMVVE